MAATKLQVNFTNIAHGSVSITKVTNFTISPGGSLISFSGDIDIFPTTVVNAMNNPRASVTSGDIGTVMGISPGTTATLTATLKDAKASAGGDILYSLINAVFENSDASAAHAQFGSCNASWLAYSSDGVTNPLSFTRA